MRQIEEIKEMIRGMMAQEMENFKEAVGNGDVDGTVSSVVYTMLQLLLAKIGQMPPVWHDIAEKPGYVDGDTTRNTIAVAGHTSVGTCMSVATMTDEDSIFVPLTWKEYPWGECPFSKWAYITDLLPSGLVMEGRPSESTEELKK